MYSRTDHTHRLTPDVKMVLPNCVSTSTFLGEFTSSFALHTKECIRFTAARMIRWKFCSAYSLSVAVSTCELLYIRQSRFFEQRQSWAAAGLFPARPGASALGAIPSLTRCVGRVPRSGNRVIARELTIRYADTIVNLPKLTKHGLHAVSTRHGHEVHFRSTGVTTHAVVLQ
jgi:hypothetical protein